MSLHVRPAAVIKALDKDRDGIVIVVYFNDPTDSHSTRYFFSTHCFTLHCLYNTAHPTSFLLSAYTLASTFTPILTLTVSQRCNLPNNLVPSQVSSPARSRRCSPRCNPHHFPRCNLVRSRASSPARSRRCFRLISPHHSHQCNRVHSRASSQVYSHRCFPRCNPRLAHQCSPAHNRASNPVRSPL